MHSKFGVTLSETQQGPEKSGKKPIVSCARAGKVPESPLLVVFFHLQARPGFSGFYGKQPVTPSSARLATPLCAAR